MGRSNERSDRRLADARAHQENREQREFELKRLELQCKQAEVEYAYATNSGTATSSSQNSRQLAIMSEAYVDNDDNSWPIGYKPAHLLLEDSTTQGRTQFALDTTKRSKQQGRAALVRPHKKGFFG